MAHRKLCAVTFAVLGWVTAGCSGGGGSNVSLDPRNDHPPGNSDQPINNATDRASYPDQAPINPDQPWNEPNTSPNDGAGGEGADDQGGSP